MVYQLPSSFSGGIQGAVESLKKGTLPQSITSPVVKPQEVKQTTLPKKKSSYTPLTREQFDSAMKSGFTPEQITQMEVRRKSEMEGGKQVAPQQNQNTPPSTGYNPIQTYKSNLKQVGEFIQGGIQSVAKGIGGLANFVENTPTIGERLFGNKNQPSDILKEKGLPTPANLINTGTDTVSSGVGNLSRQVGLNPESTTSKIGEFAGQAGLSTALVPGIGGATGLFPKIVAGATEGALQSGAFNAVSKGKVDKKDLTLGAVVGGAIPFVGATFNKAKNLITKSLPESLITKGLATPSALLNASERLSRLSDEGVVSIDKAPQWLLKKGIAGNKKQIQEQLTNIIKDSGKQKASLLTNTKPLTNVQQVAELQQGMGEILKNFAKVTKKGEIIPTAGNKEIVEEIVGFINNKNPTVAEFERARSLLGNMGIFTKGGALADTAQKEGLQRVWINASKYLDETIPGFRSINKDIEVANALQKAIGLKEAQDSVRQLLNMTNLWTGGLGASVGYAQSGDVKGAVLGGLGGLGGRYILNNPAVLTRLAQGLSGKKLKTAFDVAQKAGALKKVIIPGVSKLTQ